MNAASNTMSFWQFLVIFKLNKVKLIVRQCWFLEKNVVTNRYKLVCSRFSKENPPSCLLNPRVNMQLLNQCVLNNKAIGE